MHEFPLPQILGIVYGIGDVNGALIIALPPHEFIIVNVPLEGTEGAIILPDKL